MRHRRNMGDGADSSGLSPAPLTCQGLADEDATDAPQCSPLAGVVAGAANKAQQAPVLAETNSGRIGAFYPSTDGDEETKASSRFPAVTALQPGLHTHDRLQHGCHARHACHWQQANSYTQCQAVTVAPVTHGAASCCVVSGHDRQLQHPTSLMHSEPGWRPAH